jgi:CIC family chloride channel protein
MLSADSVVLWTVAGFLAVRFVLGPLSYAAAAPPVAVRPTAGHRHAVGSAVLQLLRRGVARGPAALAVPMALVGMTAFFGATVRGPLTAVVIVIEMTATHALAVPMLAATAAAVLVAEALRCPPIYDSLRERMPRR